MKTTDALDILRTGDRPLLDLARQWTSGVGVGCRPKGLVEGADRTLRAVNLLLAIPLASDAQGALMLAHAKRHQRAAERTWAGPCAAPSSLRSRRAGTPWSCLWLLKELA